MRSQEPLRPEEVLAASQARARRGRLLLSCLAALGVFLGAAPTGAAGEAPSAEVLSTSEAIRRWQVAASPWPDDVKRAVIAREVRPGFTRDQVLLALAEPDRVEGPPGAARWVYLTGAGAAGDAARLEGPIVFAGQAVHASLFFSRRPAHRR